jgi:transketolase N-terminal domain/subunit
MYTALLDPAAMERLQDLGQQLRIDSVRASTAAKSGNPTSAMSAADLMAVLLARNFRYDFADPHATGDDHLIFSKGHAAALLYAMLRAAGAIADEELLTFRARGSRLEGHRSPGRRACRRWRVLRTKRAGDLLQALALIIALPRPVTAGNGPRRPAASPHLASPPAA